MSKIDLSEWVLNEKFGDSERFVSISVYLTYININSILHLSPIERKKKIAEDKRKKFSKLLATGLFENYKLLGTTDRPEGIKTKIPFSTLSKLEKLNYVRSVFIKKIDNAKKIKEPKRLEFFCVKMTVVVEVENQRKGMQTIEERMVLVRARSFDDAYYRLDKKKEVYAKPYLNSYGELVRWRIISFDDCYSVGVYETDEFNNPEGVEVYSKLKSRRLTKDRIWDGKIK